MIYLRLSFPLYKKAESQTRFLSSLASNTILEGCGLFEVLVERGRYMFFPFGLCLTGVDLVLQRAYPIAAQPENGKEIHEHLEIVHCTRTYTLQHAGLPLEKKEK